MAISNKDLSEIVKNWVTSITLGAGLLITIFKGPSYVAEKEKEIKLRNNTLSSKLLMSKIEIINSLETSIAKIIKIRNQNNSRKFYKLTQ